jgi:hypothetical protein
MAREWLAISSTIVIGCVRIRCSSISIASCRCHGCWPFVVQHPQLYESQKGASYISRARSSLMNLFEGIMPGRGKGYGRDMYEGARDTGREMYDKATGRSLYDKITGRGLTDKAGEYAQDLSYGARRGMETAKDVGYGISHKLGDMAESVKQTFVGERDRGYGGEGYRRGGVGSSWFGGGGGREESRETGRGWFGGRSNEPSYGGGEDLSEATSKIKRVVGKAQREY